MSETAHGSRAGTTITKPTKNTGNAWLFVVCAASVIDLPLSENESGKTVAIELPLAPFGRGVYSIELIAASGGKTEHRRLTFIMK